LLLWIKGGQSPAEIREMLLSEDLVYRSRLIDWLESCCQGEFSSGTMSFVASRSSRKAGNTGDDDCDDSLEVVHGDPTATLPSRPPQTSDPAALATWFSDLQREADDIVYCSNRHSPKHNSGCRKQDNDDCRARFPRKIEEHTRVDAESGALILKKREQWINNFSVILSYVLRCNTDVTCLLSGTMVRAVIAYVTDYVTKSSLKTHTMFEVIHMV
ncbi:hypothetical protein BDY19DRAFT_869786, partial [Irpex rosettiformis]